MPILPERLICSSEKVEVINQNRCPQCSLLRRTDAEDIEDLEKNLDKYVFTFKEFPYLSLNIFHCNTKKLSIKSEIFDVNFVTLTESRTKFQSDNQVKRLRELYEDEIEYKLSQNPIIKMKVEDIDGLSGTFEYHINNNPCKHKFKISVKSDPLVFNPFHHEVHVQTDVTGEFKNIDSKKAKKISYRGFLMEIRENLIRLKKLKPLPSI